MIIRAEPYFTAKNGDNCETAIKNKKNNYFKSSLVHLLIERTFNGTLQNKSIHKNPQIFENSLIS